VNMQFLFLTTTDQSFCFVSGNRAIPGRWSQKLQHHLCHLFCFLVVLTLYPADNLGYRLCMCEASTISAKPKFIDWTHLKELRQGLKSDVEFTSDVTIEKDNELGFLDDEIMKEPIGLAGYRSDYAGGNDTLVHQKNLKYGFGQSFVFQRFQSPVCIRKALDSVRSISSFKWFEGKDGRKGYISTTNLGGDCVLAESEQIAINCRTEDVLRVYLSGKIQTHWNAKDCLKCHITKFKNKISNPLSPRNSILERGRKLSVPNLWSDRSGNQEKRNANTAREDSYFYLQDLFLKSQRTIRGQTGKMRYQQKIAIDKIGQHNYSILVRLFKKGRENNCREENHDQLHEQVDLISGMTTTVTKPFESMEVYVGLEQMGDDVKIYAAGVFQVNRSLIPKLIFFDTSGFAGSLAGKGTLWLSAYFENVTMKRKQRQNKSEAMRRSPAL